MAIAAHMNDTDLSLWPHVIVVVWPFIFFSLQNVTKFTQIAFAYEDVFERCFNHQIHLKISRNESKGCTFDIIIIWKLILISQWFIRLQKKSLENCEIHVGNICLGCHTCVFISPKKPHDNLAFDQEMPAVSSCKPLRLIWRWCCYRCRCRYWLPVTFCYSI